MARTNYSYEKRQKELAKKAKAEEKRQRRLERRNATVGEARDASFSGEDTALPENAEG